MGLLQLISRIMIVILFLYSSISKLFSLDSFVTSVEGFQLVPKWASRMTAWAIILFEMALVVLSILGTKYALYAQYLAVALLTLFTLALITVILRRIDVSCNCFGRKVRGVRWTDVLRNAIFLSIITISIVLSAVAGVGQPTLLNFQDQVVLLLIVLVPTLITIHIDEIYRLLA